MKADSVEAKVSNIRYGKWTHSHNEEHWPLTEGFDTKQDAITDGLRNYEGDVFWVGVMRQPLIPEIDGGWIREHLSELMAESEDSYEDAHEWPDLSVEDEKWLADNVNATIRGSLVQRGYRPKWFIVDRSEQITPLEKAR